MQYRKEIDGLRAIAVVPVILFHAGFGWCTGGFIGVDIFFVISGYLITSIVSSEIEQNKFSLISFYERRARRIMPMLFFILLLSFTYAWFCFLPSDMKSFSLSLVSVVFFCSNVHFFFESGYWEVSSALKPLLHTWSLAVEEQFYLLFPLLLLYARKIKSSRLIIVIAVITIASLCFSQWSSTYAATSNFYFLPTRFWELAIGALIGLASLKYANTYAKIVGNRIVNEVMVFVGLTMIICSVLIFTESTPFPSFIALIPTIGAALIIIFASDQTIVGKLLGLSPIVTIGLISYSAYLWHQPILAFAKYQSFPGLSEATKAGLVLLVFPLSYLSWKYIEIPFKNKTAFPRKKIFTLWVCASLIFATGGMWGISNNGFENRSVLASRKVLHYQPDNKVLQKESIAPLGIVAKKHGYEYVTVGSDFDNTLWYDTLSAKHKLLIVGNSHGENLYYALNSSDSVRSKFQIARYGYQMRFFNNQPNEIFKSPNYKHADVIVICSRFAPPDLPPLPDIIKKMYMDGKVVVIVKNVFIFNTFGSRTLSDFIIQKEISNGADMNNPKVVSNVVDIIDKEYYNEYVNRSTSVYDRNVEKTFRDLKVKFKDLIVIDRMDYLCDYNRKRFFAINNQLEKFIFDDSHYTMESNSFYGRRIDQLNWMKINVIEDQLARKRNQK